VNTLMDAFNKEKGMTQMAVWIVCFNMLRVIQATGDQPAPALVSRTNPRE